MSERPIDVDDRERVARAVALAEDLLTTAAGIETRAQARRRRRLGRLVDDPESRAFVQLLTDHVPRIHHTGRAGERFHDIVTARGLPPVAGPLDRVALRLGAAVAPYLPQLVMPLVTRRLRQESDGVILPAEDPGLARHLADRRAHHLRQNVNPLGEAVLGEDEAARRLATVVAQLRRPDVDYISVKISAIHSQLDPLAFDHSVDAVCDRLRTVYRAARGDHRPGTDADKFVNLDMEEYDDLELTVAAFRRVLDEDEFADLDAGIVLQAYLPDSRPVLLDLCRWAQARHGRAGGRTKVRIVKGANLAMEQVEAELEGWPQAPYETKAEVDANYKAMLDVVLEDRFDPGVWVGVASHNLFDVAWALVLADERGASHRVELEMLEGMAPAQAQAVADRAEAGLDRPLLFYAPVVARTDFEAAIAYLVRRLDENTAPDNFLRALFDLEVGSPAWDEQRARFERAVADRHTVSHAPRRTQDRSASRPRPSLDAIPARSRQLLRREWEGFVNEADTDFALTPNRAWIDGHLAAVVDDWPEVVHPVVGGEPVALPGTRTATAADPGSPTYDVAEADRATVDRAVAAARAAAPTWAARSAEDRRAALHRVAEEMAADRGRIIATMVHDSAKTVAQADPEVSEAVDFARYYGDHGLDLESLAGDGLSFTPPAVTVVASPWNFPFAIPAGGVLAALASGSAVVLKPAPESVVTAALIVEACHRAGVPGDVVHLVPTADDDVGRALITHPDVDTVILTGAHDTARLFHSWDPNLRLHAETSGKNSLVITATADLDAAIADLVHSAFGHGGQKCSAASLAVVESRVLDDPAFLRRLVDAASSLEVGQAHQLATTVAPLTQRPTGALERALHQLDEGERWLLEPARLDDHGHLWRPGIRLGVQPGSWFHRTECFGPVLGIIRARDLDHAIDIQNAVAYGLTGGIHALDPAEIARWTDRVEVGNAYVNRQTTGAIVRRQPFGGWKRSVVGPTAKAGGPNYLLTLGRWTVDELSPERAEESFDRAWSEEFGAEHDPSALRSEANVLRYRPLPRVVVRVGAGAPAGAVAIAREAARTVSAGIEVSVANPLVAGPPGGPAPVVESDTELAARILSDPPDRVRLLRESSAKVRAAAHEAGVVVDDNPMVDRGRIELLRWVREQAISRTRHRHGNVVADPV